MLILNSQLKPIDRIAFSPDAGILAIAGGSRKPIDLWSLDSPLERIHRLAVRLDRGLWRFAFTPADGLLLVADDTEVVAFDPATGEEVWRIEPEEFSVLAGLTISADGRWLGTGLLFQGLSNVGYQWWSLNGRKPPKRKIATKGSDGFMCRGVAFIPPGKALVAAEDKPVEKPARLHVLSATGRTQHVLTTKLQMVQQLITSTDGRLLAAQFTRSILVWNMTAITRPPISLMNDNRQGCTGIAFYPSGRYLAATSNDQTVKLYDTETWEFTKTFTWDIGRMRSIAFSPDGMLAAAGSDTGKVVVWDVDL